MSTLEVNQRGLAVLEEFERCSELTDDLLKKSLRGLGKLASKLCAYTKPRMAKTAKKGLEQAVLFVKDNLKVIVRALFVISMVYVSYEAAEWLMSNTSSSMVFSDPSWIITKAYNKYIGEPITGFFGMLLIGFSVLRGLLDVGLRAHQLSTGIVLTIFAVTWFFPVVALAMATIYISTKTTIKILFN